MILMRLGTNEYSILSTEVIVHGTRRYVRRQLAAMGMALVAIDILFYDLENSDEAIYTCTGGYRVSGEQVSKAAQH